MNRTLLTQALIKFLAGILLIGLLVFLPAGSVLRFPPPDKFIGMMRSAGFAVCIQAKGLRFIYQIH